MSKAITSVRLKLAEVMPLENLEGDDSLKTGNRSTITTTTNEKPSAY